MKTLEQEHRADTSIPTVLDSQKCGRGDRMEQRRLGTGIRLASFLARRPTPKPRSSSLSTILATAILLNVGTPAAFSACPVGGTPSTYTYDIVVAGAGAGGVAAAIQAASLGHDVVVLEETDWIGGQMTTSAVSTMDGGRFPTANSGTGIYADFLDRIRNYYSTQFSPPKSIDTCYWWNVTECFEPSVGRSILQQMLDQAGVDVCLRTRVIDTVTSGNTVEGVETDDGDTFLAHVVLDGTEYGDIIPLTPADYRVGNHFRGDLPGPDSCVQDITYTAVVKEYPAPLPPALVVPTPPMSSYEEVKPLFQSIVQTNGTEPFCYADHNNPNPLPMPVNPAFHNSYRGLPDSTNPNNYTVCDAEEITKTIINWANDYPSPGDLSTSYIENLATREALNCEAKLRTIMFIYYMQNELGLTNWSVATDEGFATPYNISQNICWLYFADIEVHMPLAPYVRESRRLVATQMLTAEDLKDLGNPRNGRADTNFLSAVAVGDYMTDLHGCVAPENFEDDMNETWDDRSPGRGFQVPFGSLIPEVVDGFLPASKSIGASRLANGAVRLQPIEMAIGQAAGAIAAIAVSENQQPRDVSVWRVQETLLDAKSGLSLYKFSDVPITDPDWAAVQFTSLHEMIIGDANGNFLLNNEVGRGLLALIAARMAELDFNDCAYQGIFADVPESNIFHCAIEAIYTAGITGGCGTNPLRFCPGSLTTRIQFATFIVRSLGLENHPYPLDPIFDDVGAGHQLFRYVQIAGSLGFFSGCTNSFFCPGGTITRRAAARVIMRSLEWRETH